MSFSRNRDRRVQSALQPYNYTSPFGSVLINPETHAMEFLPHLDLPTRDQLNFQNTKINDVLRELPTRLDVNQAYNNPFYQAVLQLVKNPIDTQRDEEERMLKNRLNAQNQLGGSYDALQRYLLGRRYDELYRNAEGQARQEAFKAYNQSFDNMLNALRGLRADQSALQDNLYRPLSASAGLQNQVSELQRQLAGYEANRKSPLETALGLLPFGR